MPYRERRLVFILSRINDLYGLDDEARPPVGDIDALKAKVWSMIAEIRAGTVAAVGLIRLGGALDVLDLSDTEAVAMSPKAFARAKKDDLQKILDQYADNVKSLSDDSAELLTTFRAHTTGWTSAGARDSLLNRYLGFALWDGILFPTISLSELPQLSPNPGRTVQPTQRNSVDTTGRQRRNQTGQAEGYSSSPFRSLLRRRVPRERLPVGPVGRRGADSANALRRGENTCIRTDRGDRRDPAAPRGRTRGGTRHRRRPPPDQAPARVSRQAGRNARSEPRCRRRRSGRD